MDAKTVFCFFVLHMLCIQALPTNNEIKDSSCISMTPERVKELNDISEELNKFIEKLSDKYEDIDFTFLEIKMENHNDDEEEEKETIIKISVKDCNSNATNEVEYSEKSDEPTKTEDDVENDGDDTDVNNEDITHVDKNTNIKSHNQSSKMININKTYKTKSVVEENINESEDKSVKIYQSKTKTALDSNLTELSEIADNNKERVGDKSNDKLYKNEDIQQSNRQTDNQNKLTDNDEVKNVNKDIDKHNINKDIGRSNIIIYAPNIDNRNIAIGSEYANDAIGMLLAGKQLAKYPIFNPTEPQNPADVFDFFNIQTKDFDTAEVAVKDNSDAQPLEGNENTNSNKNEAKNVGFEMIYEDPFAFWWQ